MSNFSTITTADDYVNYVFQISTRGVSEATSELVGVGHTIQNVLGNLAFKTAEYLTHAETAYMGMGLAAAASFAHATKSAIQFQQATASVEAISGKQLSGSYIGERAMAMSNQFGLAVSDMTQGLEALARAGITAESSLNQLLQSGVQMSKFEGRDLEESINDILSTTNLLNPNVDMNSAEYAQIVADLNQRIISTSESAPINAKNIMDTIQHVGGYASAAQLDQEDLFATIAQLGAKGTKGELAGTALRAFVSAGQKDTAQRALSRIGLDVSDLWDENGEAMLPISEMKRVLDDALNANGYSAQQKLEFYSDFVGYKQANQIMKIDPSSIDIYKDKIDHAMSVTDKMNIILGTVQGNWSQITNTVSNFMTKVGGTLLPIINALLIPVKFVVKLIDAIPFGHIPVAAGLLLVAFRGISIVVNNIVPTLAHFVLTMDGMEKRSKGISGFFKDTVESLQQTKQILSHLDNPEFMAAQVRERTIKSTNKRMQKNLENAAVEEILKQQMGLKEKENGQVDYVWNTLSDQEKTYYMEMKRPDQAAIDAQVESIMEHYDTKYLVAHLGDVYRKGPIMAGDEYGNMQEVPQWAPAAEGWVGIETIGMDWEWLKKILSDILGAVHEQNNHHDPWREPGSGRGSSGGSTSSGGPSSGSTGGSSSSRSSSSGSTSSGSTGRSSSGGSTGRSSSSRSSSSGSSSSSSTSSGSTNRGRYGQEIVNVLTSTFNLNAQIYTKLENILSTIEECCARKAEQASSIPEEVINNNPHIPSEDKSDNKPPSSGSSKPPRSGSKPPHSGSSKPPRSGSKPPSSGSSKPSSSSKSSPLNKQANDLLAAALNEQHLSDAKKYASKEGIQQEILNKNRHTHISPNAINKRLEQFNNSKYRGKKRDKDKQIQYLPTDKDVSNKTKADKINEFIETPGSLRNGARSLVYDANTHFKLPNMGDTLPSYYDVEYEEDKKSPKKSRQSKSGLNFDKDYAAEQIRDQWLTKNKGATDADFNDMIIKKFGGGGGTIPPSPPGGGDDNDDNISGVKNQAKMNGATTNAQANASTNNNIPDNIKNMTEDEEVYVDTDATLTVDGENKEDDKSTPTKVNVTGGAAASINNTSSLNSNTNVSPNVNNNINTQATQATSGSSQQGATVQTTFNANTQNTMHDASSLEINPQQTMSQTGSSGIPDTMQTTLGNFGAAEEEEEDINIDNSTQVNMPSDDKDKSNASMNINVHGTSSSGDSRGSGKSNSSAVINNNIAPNINTAVKMHKPDSSAFEQSSNNINVQMQNTVNKSSSMNNSQSLMNNVNNQSTLDDFQSSKPSLSDVGLEQGNEEEMEIDMSDEIILPNLTKDQSTDVSSGGSSTLTFDMGSGGSSNAHQNTVVNNNINVATPSSNASATTLDNFMPTPSMSPALQKTVKPPSPISKPTTQTTLTGGTNSPINNMNITMQDNLDNASTMSGLDTSGGTTVAPSTGSSLGFGGGIGLDTTQGEEDVYLNTAAVVEFDPSFLKGTTQQAGKPKGNFTLNMQPDKNSGRSNLAKSGSRVRGNRGGFNRPSGRPSKSATLPRSSSNHMARTPNINTPPITNRNFAGNMPQLPDMNTPSLPSGNDTNNASKISVDVKGGNQGDNTIRHMVQVDDNASENNLIGTHNAQGTINPPINRKPVEVVATDNMNDMTTSDTNETLDTEEDIEVEVEDGGNVVWQPRFDMSIGIDGLTNQTYSGEVVGKRQSCCDLILRALTQIIDLLSSTQTTLVSSVEEIVTPLSVMAEGVKTQQTASESQHKETDEERKARYAKENQEIMSGLHGAAQQNVEEWEKKRAERERRIRNSKENQEILSGLQYSTQYEAEKEAAARKQRMIDDNNAMFGGMWNAAQENYKTTPEYIREQKIRESYSRIGEAYHDSIFGSISDRISGTVTKENYKNIKNKTASGKNSIINKLNAKFGPKLKDGDKELDIHREILGEKGREAQEKMNAASGIAKDLGFNRTAEVIDYGSNMLGGVQERFGKVMKLSKDAQNLDGHFKVFKGSKHAKSIQKAGSMVEKTLGKVATKFVDFLPTLIEFLPVIAGVAAVALVAVKALEWSAASHDAYVKKLKEEQKEYTARSQAEQQTYENAKKRTKIGHFRSEGQREYAQLQYELSSVRLEAANIRRQATNFKLQRQEDDGLWGEYGLRAAIQKNGLGGIFGAGDFESQADKYQGTTQHIREIKEYSMSWNPFDNVTNAERQVAQFYDIHRAAFAEMDNYKQELGELYDFESKMMRVTGSQENARGSMQFRMMLDKYSEKTGLSQDKLMQYLDWMQTEHQVDTASQAMQARVDTMVGETQLKAMAIGQGVDPEVLKDIGSKEAQEALVQAQADMIRQQAASQLWWQAVWDTLSAFGWGILSPVISIWNVLAGIWDILANLGLIIKEATDPAGTGHWKQEDKDAIEAYHGRVEERQKWFEKNPSGALMQQAMTEFEGAEKIRNEDLTETGKSVQSEWDRGDFGNSPAASYGYGGQGDYMSQGINTSQKSNPYLSSSSTSNNASKTTTTTNNSSYSTKSTTNDKQTITNTSSNLANNTANEPTNNKPKTLEEAVLSIEEMVRVIAQSMSPTMLLGNKVQNLFNKKSNIPNGALDNILNSNNNNSGVNYNTPASISINEININTEDDPEKIKTALMNLIVELQEQVSPRIVSRSINQNNTQGGTDTNVQTEDNNNTNPTI